jgi:TspO/MBR family
MSRSSATVATETRSLGSVTAQDRVRQSVVIASMVMAIIGSFIGSGAAGGTPIQDAVGGALSADSTLIAPAGPAFSIWSIIYAGLIAYAIWQALPAQAADNRQRRVGYWVAASLLLNAAWILSVQFGSLELSAVMIVALLVVLIVTFIILGADRPRGWLETVVLDGTMGLYLGWVTIATVANLTALFVAAGFGGFGIPADVWGVVLVAVAALIGISLAFWDGGRLAPSASLSWGLSWVAVSRLTGDLISVPTAIAAATGAAAVVLVTVIVRLAQKPDALPRYRGRREATSSSTASDPA